MTCDNTTPAKHEKESDIALAVYVDSHRSVARYTLVLKEHVGESAPFTVIQPGLEYVSADAECKRLNEALESKGFGQPIYSVRLENKDEARHPVRIAADQYWEKRRVCAQ